MTRVAIAAGAALILLSGCVHVFDARTLGANVRVATAPGEATCATPFRRSQKAVFLLWGAVRATRPSLEHALGGQVTGSDEITNLRIRVRSRFSDLLFTAFTGGLVVPRSVTFDGCVTPTASAERSP